jgi:hypothetical protein
VTNPNVRVFNPCRRSDADSKLTAAVFEQLACALVPAAIATTWREHMRRIVRASASPSRRKSN